MTPVDPTPAPGCTTPPDARASRCSRDRLIEAAAVLFHEDGYRAVSLDRVLRESGVVRSNFYYHFKSKEELALAVIDAWRERLRAEVLEPALRRSDLPPLRRVGLLIGGLIERLEGDACRGGCPFGTLANSEAEHNDRFRAKLTETFDGFAQLLGGLFAEAAGRGDLPATSPGPAQLAALALGFLQGGYLLAKTYADSTPMRLGADGLLAVLGVAAEPTTA